MTLQSIINLARSGELKKLSDQSYTDEIIIDYINLGLIELYKRFQLQTEELVITFTNEAKTIYTLGVDTDGVTPLDSDVSYPNGYSEVMVIQEAYDEDGNSYNINEESDLLSIFTISQSQLQIPNPSIGSIVSIIYRPSPTYYTESMLTNEINMPSSLVEALLSYIGYRAHGAMDGNINAENNTHYTRFEASCLRAANLGVVTADSLDTTYNLFWKGYA